MRSKSINFRVPSALENPLQSRIAEAGYSNRAAYIMGLVRHDLMTRYEHKITSPIAKMPLDQQDEIDDWIAECYEKGEPLRSAWWDVAIRQAVKEAAKGKEVPEEKIIKNLLKTIKKGNQPSSK
jgi:predicted transcriptional regulator